MYLGLARLGAQPTSGLAQPDQARVGSELDEDPVLPRVADHEGRDIGDAHRYRFRLSST